MAVAEFAVSAAVVAGVVALGAVVLYAAAPIVAALAFVAQVSGRIAVIAGDFAADWRSFDCSRRIAVVIAVDSVVDWRSFDCCPPGCSRSSGTLMLDSDSVA